MSTGTGMSPEVVLKRCCSSSELLLPRKRSTVNEETDEDEVEAPSFLFVVSTVAEKEDA